MTAVSFHQIEFTFDRRVMSAILNDCRELLHQAIKRHLTAKSHSRVNHVFNHFADCDFLAALYGPSEVYRAHLQRICNGVNKMLDEGNLWPLLASSSGAFTSSHPSCSILWDFFFEGDNHGHFYVLLYVCVCISAIIVTLKFFWLVSPKCVSFPALFFLFHSTHNPADVFFFSVNECKLHALISIFSGRSLDNCALEEKYIYFFIFISRAQYLLYCLIKKTWIQAHAFSEISVCCF